MQARATGRRCFSTQWAAGLRLGAFCFFQDWRLLHPLCFPRWPGGSQLSVILHTCHLLPQAKASSPKKGTRLTCDFILEGIPRTKLSGQESKVWASRRFQTYAHTQESRSGWLWLSSQLALHWWGDVWNPPGQECPSGVADLRGLRAGCRCLGLTTGTHGFFSLFVCFVYFLPQYNSSVLFWEEHKAFRCKDIPSTATMKWIRDKTPTVYSLGNGGFWGLLEGASKVGRWWYF